MENRGKIIPRRRVGEISEESEEGCHWFERRGVGRDRPAFQHIASEIPVLLSHPGARHYNQRA